MKRKIIALFFLSLIGAMPMYADGTNQGVSSSSDDNDTNTHIYRAPARRPLSFYQTEDGIVIVSKMTTEQNSSITITDANGMVMKCETVVIEPGQDTLLYIGDLASGTYELTIETDSYTLHGSFEVE